MPGPLTKHPYLKSWDELQRTAKRMRTYRDMHLNLLPKEERHSLDKMIDATEKAMNEVPKEYRLTKHHQYKED